MAARLRASRSDRGRALRANARQSSYPEDLAGEVVRIPRGIENPVLRLQATNALVGSVDQLRDMRRASVLELRAEAWTDTEIAEEIGTTRQRAWQIANGG